MPWLAANLDRLSAAIRIPLELTGTEICVGAFNADILALNANDDSVVLIENQLEGSDHAHLGQIVTYPAGLEAQAMVWIAPSFRDEHLSAIRRLNEHMVDPFAFFAVRLRVVRIADSPYALLFEVVERRNNRDRQVSEKKRAVERDRSEIGEHRLAFWTRLCARRPTRGRADAASSRWAPLPGTDSVVVRYLSRDGVGVFVRPPRGGSSDGLERIVLHRLDQLAADLDAKREVELGSRLTIDPYDRANWDQMASACCA